MSTAKDLRYQFSHGMYLSPARRVEAEAFVDAVLCQLRHQPIGGRGMNHFEVDKKPHVVCGQCGNTKAEAKSNGFAHMHSWVKYRPSTTSEEKRR